MLRVVRMEHSTREDGLRRMTLSRLIHASAPHLFDDECGWTGVFCINNDNEMVSIRWNELNVDLCYGILLNWLPNSLCRVYLDRILTTDMQAFLTRYLPRCATVITFTYLNIAGTLDLSTLPPKIETLKMIGNGYSGTVYLMHLPPTLEEIDLRHTFIDTVVVDNVSLPIKFYRAQVSNQKQNVKIVTAETSGEEIDDRVLVYHYTKRGVARHQFGITMDEANETYDTIIM
uniref:Uncharacterized protein n=1 Tax=Paramoeba aestuarina TaxID=180227 RepID=A0A7S4KME3_9EUKA|mmetsp:Transcript_21438/g.33312  ORF Transcript_21438/g.33312 Transcript_21438/m.33312 type:complete len:231 (+) Transcript_21438:1-693(+)